MNTTTKDKSTLPHPIRIIVGHAYMIRRKDKYSEVVCMSYEDGVINFRFSTSLSGFRMTDEGFYEVVCADLGEHEEYVWTREHIWD